MALSYRIEGQGPPLVLFHGWGVTFSIWEYLAPLLSPYYTLIMLEMPGNGSSPLPPAGMNYYEAAAYACEDLRSELGIAQWAVLGYSIGAWGACWYANCYPEHTTHIVLICPLILQPMSGVGLSLLGALDTLYPPLGNWLLSGWRIQRLIQLLGFNGRPHPYAELWFTNVSSQPMQILKTTLYDLAKTRHTEFTLPDKPAVFIWGKKDVLAIPPRRPGLQDILIAGNHSVPMLQAEQVADIIRQLLH